MDPERFRDLVAEQTARDGAEPRPPAMIEPFRVPGQSSPLALALLDDAGSRRLDGGELLVMLEEASLHDLGRVAHALRMARCDSKHVTYVVDRNITYTNLCYADCTFCAFNRHKGDSDAYLLSIHTILEKCRTVVEAGGSQILLQGGHHPKRRLDYYESMLAAIKSAYPQMWIHGFSPSEILHFSRLNRLVPGQVLRRLKAAGLDSIPGGGAEILSDRVRGAIAPGKASASEWISVSEAAHVAGLPTTVTMMFQHIESYAERIEHLLRVRESQDRTGGYTAFISWSFQPGNTPLMDIPEQRDQVESHGFLGSLDYLRTLALSRIALDNFANIQASWVTQGKALGQLTLFYGANDLGSTMMEESVVSATGSQHRLTRNDLEEMINGAGFMAARRDNGYNILDES